MSPSASHAGSAAARMPLEASGPTGSPWLKILAVCLKFTLAACVLMSAAALVFTGVEGLSSVIFGTAVVVVFFALSLLIGHYAGRNNPSGAVGLFLVTYVIKVVGFAAVLFAVGAPDWLDRTWFFTAAVAVVIVWQSAEVWAFSRIRHQLYGPVPVDSATAADGSATPADGSATPVDGPVTPSDGPATGEGTPTS